MIAAWKPGSVALAEYGRGAPKVYMYQREFGTDRYRWVSEDGTTSVAFESADWYRPLVVLDPENMVQVERLAEVLNSKGCRAEVDLQRGLRAYIEAQTKPPKPEAWSHLAVDSGEVKLALCGKVWRSTTDVKVIGKCPDCLDLSEHGWSE